MIDITHFQSPEAATATAVYAIGDLHGRLDLLLAMEAAIKVDIVQTRAVRPVICYLGDYVDRGPHSAQVIGQLCNFQESHIDEGIQRVFLKGNHEDRMLAFFENPREAGPAWLKFGGRDTFGSYGLELPETLADADWFSLCAALQMAMHPKHLRFLRNLKVVFAWRGYRFIHAGVNPENSMTQQFEHDLMWTREPFLSSSVEYGFQVVHGHVIVPEPEFRDNRIGVDTGAYRSGKLTCVVVDGEGARILQVSDRP
jgi:serine/threonine protein phosphatase 1